MRKLCGKPLFDAQKVAVLLLLILANSLVAGGEHLARLQIGEEIYTNLNVTLVTATDIYFTHSRGLANAKLKNLEPELQRKFNFDAATAGLKEKEQQKSHARY